MKFLLNLGWPATDWKTGAVILWLLVTLAVGGGCGKPESSPPRVASSPASNLTTTAAPTAGPTAEPIAAPTAASTAMRPIGPTPPAIPSNFANSGLTQLQVLNRVLLGWEIKNHRRPQSFEEFAGTANYQIPDPPPGKKYAFSPKGFIVLVNSTQ